MITITNREAIINKPIPVAERSFTTTKRVIDIVGSSMLFVITIPLLLIIYILIKIESPGPAIIIQTRVGYKGKSFRLYKFRTMHAHVNLYDNAPRTVGDKRITRLGKFLRQTSFDELPQLINILNGTMSLVGPRPEMPHIVATYKDWQRMRFEAKPGLTGLWQICGRKDLPLLDNIEYDLYYIQNQSVILDMKILVRTIPVVLKRRGAY